MPSTDTVVIGAGHAGLAMSRCLADRDVRHVVMDRGCVGERWRTARWDSFRLLTPNWLSRLPGWRYTGPEPDGFMYAGEFVGYLCDYARSFDAPVRPHSLVTRVERAAAGFAVHTDDAVWSARSVVIATGYHSRAKVPELAVGLLPRRYRGRDILWWLDRIGSLDRTIDQVPDPASARAEPSLQLAGTGDGHGLDLDVLRRVGVRPVGRLRALDGTRARFADDLRDTVGAAQHAGGRIRHRRGVTEVAGLYAIGLRFQYRRNSTFVDGARHDAAHLADKITADRAVRVGVCGGFL